MTARWPIDVLAPASFGMNLAPRNLRSPSSIAGASQVVSSSAGIWVITMGGIAIRTREQRRLWREWQLLLEGMLNPVLIPMRRADQPVAAATINDPLAVGTTGVDITITSGSGIEAGHGFSVGDGEFYRIRTIAGAAITFRPPLRTALADNAALEFVDATCRCRLASDQEMDVDFEGRRYASPTIRLFEDV